MTYAHVPRRIATVLAPALIAILALAAVAVAKPAHQRGARGCGHVKEAKKHHRGGCRGGSKRPRHRIVRHRFRLSVPARDTAEGLSAVVSVRCPGHRKALGGGVEVSQPNLSVVLSVPDEGANRWLAQLVNLSTGAIHASFMVYAICA